jgi:hypothetical protein
MSRNTLYDMVRTGLNTINVKFLSPDTVEPFKEYIDSVNKYCFDRATEIGGKEGAIMKDIFPSPTPKSLNQISLQQIYSLLILFQGNSFFNEYFGKIFAVEAACAYGRPVKTRGLETKDIPFIMANSAKINSLFDLGPLDKCASLQDKTNSKPMIENYLTNSKSCIVKVNNVGQIVIETTFAYVVEFEEKLVAIVLSKDEANLTTGTYKQMDQVRNVLTSQNKEALMSSLSPSDSELKLFLQDLQPLDTYNRQYNLFKSTLPSHKYDGAYCVFLDPDKGKRVGTSEREKKCMATANLIKSGQRTVTDVGKRIGRTAGIGNDKVDSTQRDVSPLQEDNQNKNENETDIVDRTQYDRSSLSQEYPVPLVENGTRFGPLPTCPIKNK